MDFSLAARIRSRRKAVRILSRILSQNRRVFQPFFFPNPCRKIHTNFGKAFPSGFSGCSTLVCVAAFVCQYFYADQRRLARQPFLLEDLLATQPREHRLSDLDFPGQKPTPDPLCACTALMVCHCYKLTSYVRDGAQTTAKLLIQSVSAENFCYMPLVGGGGVLAFLFFFSFFLSCSCLCF